jgi:hypothetical protein
MVAIQCCIWFRYSQFKFCFLYFDCLIFHGKNIPNVRLVNITSEKLSMPRIVLINDGKLLLWAGISEMGQHKYKQIQWGSDIRANLVIEWSILPITGHAKAILNPDIECYRITIYVRILRFFGYRASRNCTLTAPKMLVHFSNFFSYSRTK